MLSKFSAAIVETCKALYRHIPEDVLGMKKKLLTLIQKAKALIKEDASIKFYYETRPLSL